MKGLSCAHAFNKKYARPSGQLKFRATLRRKALFLSDSFQKIFGGPTSERGYHSFKVLNGGVEIFGERFGREAFVAEASFNGVVKFGDGTFFVGTQDSEEEFFSWLCPALALAEFMDEG